MIRKSIENKKIDEIIPYLDSDFEIKIKFNKFNKTIVSINELKQDQDLSTVFSCLFIFEFILDVVACGSRLPK